MPELRYSFKRLVEKRPEDIELHKLLKEIYEQLQLDLEKKVETDILNLVRGICHE